MSHNPEIVHDEQVILADAQMNDAFYINPFEIPDNYEFNSSLKMTEQDCLDLYTSIVAMYREDKVIIDNAAERFLQRARFVQSSATFHGLMRQAMEIEYAIHKMCGENHDVQAAFSRELSHLGNQMGRAHEHQHDKETEQNHSKGCMSEKGGTCDCRVK